MLLTFREALFRRSYGSVIEARHACQGVFLAWRYLLVIPVAAEQFPVLLAALWQAICEIVLKLLLHTAQVAYAFTYRAYRAFDYPVVVALLRRRRIVSTFVLTFGCHFQPHATVRFG